METPPGSAAISWSDRRDVIAAVTEVEQLAPGRPIIVFGSSMGAAAAIFAAARLQHRVRGYILDSPYLTLARATRLRLRQRLPPPFDLIAMEGMSLWAPFFLHTALHDISPVNHLHDIPADVPVLLMKGALDGTIPGEDFQAMSVALGRQAWLVQFPHSHHTDAQNFDPAIFRTEVLGFVHAIK